MGSAAISVDEFQALEQKVLRAVDLIKKEREARATAESERDAAKDEAANLREKLMAAEEQLASVDEKLMVASEAQIEIESLNREREAVRLRVEKMLAQMDELL